MTVVAVVVLGLMAWTAASAGLALVVGRLLASHPAADVWEW